LDPIGNQTIEELQPLSFTVTATDDGPAPILSASNLPSGASFTSATGVFSWTPTAGTAASSPFSITFTATDAIDSGLTDDETISIEVTAPAIADCTVEITSPAVGVLQTSTDLEIIATFSCTPEIPAGWGVELAAIGDNGASDECIENFTPYTCTFGLPRDEYTVTATVVDDMDNVVIGSGAAQDQVTSVGIGDYYVAVGDSITSGRGDDIAGDNTSADGRNVSAGYPPILNDELTAELDYPHTVVNAGVEGDTSSQGLSALSGVLSANSEAQFVLVMYGMNDAGPPTPVPSGLGLNPGDGGYPGSFKDNMQRIINVIVADGKQAVVARINIALGDSATGPQYPDPETGARSVLVQEYNQVIVSELSNRTLGPDFFTFYLNNAGQYSDNIHPDGIGYQSMADLWRQVLVP
ncbi:MAG: GDSL-type esterase/lipase family protein, partial [Pseudomonadales bacterium]